MLRYLLSRLLSLAVSLAVASVVIFAVVEVIPGDPASYMLGLNAEPETVAALRRELGLEGPVVRGISTGWAGMLTAISASPTPTACRWRSWSADAALGVVAAADLCAGADDPDRVSGRACWRRRTAGRAADVAVMGTTQLGIAVPNFWFAMLLVLVFAI